VTLAVHVGDEVIHSLVQSAYDELTPAKVHTYLPILVLPDRSLTPLIATVAHSGRIRTPSRARRCQSERALGLDRVDGLLAVDHVLEVPHVLT
jgi:hypothetical protein